LEAPTKRVSVKRRHFKKGRFAQQSDGAKAYAKSISLCFGVQLRRIGDVIESGACIGRQRSAFDSKAQKTSGIGESEGSAETRENGMLATLL
jgi:hypothetical protein